MRTNNLVGTIFWLAIGVYVAITAYRLGLGSFRQPGPGFIFFLAALLLIILSTVEVLTIIIGKPEKGKDEVEKPIWSGLRWGKVLLVLVGLSIYVYIFNFLGFLLSTFLLMVFLFKAVEPTRWWISILGGLITIFIAYGVFSLWLNVPFPQGVFGF